MRAEGRDALLMEELRMRAASDLVIDEAEPIEMDRAEAKEKLWTPSPRVQRRRSRGSLDPRLLSHLYRQRA